MVFNDWKSKRMVEVDIEPGDVIEIKAKIKEEYKKYQFKNRMLYLVVAGNMMYETKSGIEEKTKLLLVELDGMWGTEINFYGSEEGDDPIGKLDEKSGQIYIREPQTLFECINSIIEVSYGNSAEEISIHLHRAGNIIIDFEDRYEE